MKTTNHKIILTGNTRFRVGTYKKSLFGKTRQILILQHEMIVPTEQPTESTVWVDSKPEWIMRRDCET